MRYSQVRKLLFPTKVGQVRDQFDEDLLRGVFGILREVHHPKHDVVDPGLMTGNQPFESLPVPALRLAYQLPVLGIGSRTFCKRISHALPLEPDPMRL